MLVKEASYRVEQIKAKYDWATEKVSEGHMEWRRILCETNTTGDFVTRVQRALLKAGHSPGKIDGVLGRDTRAAVNSYQKANGLAAGALTYETVTKMSILETGTCEVDFPPPCC